MTSADPTEAFKQKAKGTWATGSYGDVASYLVPMSARLVAAAGVARGQKVLDIGTGTGITAITARRAGADVAALDLTPELLARAKEEADLAGVEGIEWREGDAEALPWPDGAFDAVLSSFGHMFAPRPEVAGRELVRVARPGGRIAFATHPPDNVAASFFAATARHVPPPPNAPPSPFQWGDEQKVRERLGPGVAEVRFERGTIEFPMLSPAHFWHLFSTRYGPTMRAVDALGGDRAKVEALKRDFVKAVEPFFEGNVVRQEYLLTVATKKR